jgi:hypothetical protein
MGALVMIDGTLHPRFKDQGRARWKLARFAGLPPSRSPKLAMLTDLTVRCIIDSGWPERYWQHDPAPLAKNGKKPLIGLKLEPSQTRIH